MVISREVKESLLVLQSVMLRSGRQIRYVWVDCPRHLTHLDELRLMGGEVWEVIEIFVIKRYFEKDEVEKVLSSGVKVLKVLEGGSYDIRKCYANKSCQSTKL